MITYETSSSPQRFLARLQNAGIEPGDSEELRLNKSLLMLATGLASVAIMIWVAIYLALGPQFSTTAPLVFQLLLAGNMLLFIRTRNFDFFRVTQLGLFLFLPFIAQWSGTIISTSGVLLWALLGPIGAILCIGVRQSVGWFIAWVILTALSGAADWYLADTVFGQKSNVPVRTTIVFFALNFIAISTIIYLLLRRSIAERRKTLDSLELAHKQIQIEQERSEKLLLNILPGSIADRLKTSDKTIADGFADVTVMFADIVNFTQVAANMSPSQVFAMLNRIFSAFDELAEQYGLEKIKTIGDAYMVASGVPEPVPDFAARLARMAIDMQEAVHELRASSGYEIDMRMGLATGPVMAGVIGRQKFSYDIWGDAVNLAARLENTSVPGRIHVCPVTRERLGDAFDVEPRGAIEIKGVGKQDTWFLIAARASAVAKSA